MNRNINRNEEDLLQALFEEIEASIAEDALSEDLPTEDPETNPTAIDAEEGVDTEVTEEAPEVEETADTVIDPELDNSDAEEDAIENVNDIENEILAAIKDGKVTAEEIIRIGRKAQGKDVDEDDAEDVDVEPYAEDEVDVEDAAEEDINNTDDVVPEVESEEELTDEEINESILAYLVEALDNYSDEDIALILDENDNTYFNKFLEIELS